MAEDLYARNPDGSLVSHDSKGRKIKRDVNNAVVSVGGISIDSYDADAPVEPTKLVVPPTGPEYPRGKQVLPDTAYPTDKK
jgi:hypothetical protein